MPADFRSASAPTEGGVKTDGVFLLYAMGLPDIRLPFLSLCLAIPPTPTCMLTAPQAGVCSLLNVDSYLSGPCVLVDSVPESRSIDDRASSLTIAATLPTP